MVSICFARIWTCFCSSVVDVGDGGCLGCSSHILAYEGDSNVVWHEGSYSEYEADWRQRNGNKDPTRVKFRKLAAATTAA